MSVFHQAAEIHKDKLPVKIERNYVCTNEDEVKENIRQFAEYNKLVEQTAKELLFQKYPISGFDIIYEKAVDMGFNDNGTIEENIEEIIAFLEKLSIELSKNPV